MLLTGETIEMYEYQMDFVLFLFMAVLLSEARTDIPPPPSQIPPNHPRPCLQFF